MFCSSCGKDNPDGKNFCRACGAKLGQANQNPAMVPQSSVMGNPNEWQTTGSEPKQNTNAAYKVIIGILVFILILLIGAVGALFFCYQNKTDSSQNTSGSHGKSGRSGSDEELLEAYTDAVADCIYKAFYVEVEDGGAMIGALSDLATEKNYNDLGSLLGEISRDNSLILNDDCLIGKKVLMKMDASSFDDLYDQFQSVDGIPTITITYMKAGEFDYDIDVTGSVAIEEKEYTYTSKLDEEKYEEDHARMVEFLKKSVN